LKKAFLMACMTLFLVAASGVPLQAAILPLAKKEPALELNPLSMDFGEVPAGSEVSETFIISNDGDGNLAIGTIIIEGSDAWHFRIGNDECSGKKVVSERSCGIEVIFAPFNEGEKTADLLIPSDDPEDEIVTASLSGYGRPGPNLRVRDSVPPDDDRTIPFGEMTTGSLRQETVTLRNMGGAELSIGSIALADPLRDPFFLATDGCSGRSLRPDESCILEVEFNPLSAVDFSDSFDIPSNDPDKGMISFTMTGSAADLPVPDIEATDSVSPADDQRISFGQILQGQTARATVTLANRGEAELNIGRISSLQAPFALDDADCSDRALNPGNTCMIAVTFSPMESGAFADSFEITSDDPDRPSLTISVHGTGVLQPMPALEVSDSISPSDDRRLAFGSVNQGTTREATVTITNEGDADLRLESIAPDLSTPFELVADDCSNAALKPGNSCTFQVGFLPSSPGFFTDAVKILSNDPEEPSLTLTLEGEGTLLPVPDIAVLDGLEPGDDLRLPFQDLTEGRSSFTGAEIVNRGDADLTLGMIGEANPLAPPFAIDFDECTGQVLSPGESCRLEVTFSPQATGAFQDAFDIPSDDPDEAALTVSVSGRGLSPQVNHPPSQPILLSPDNGEGDLGLTVTFRWKRSVDPDGDPVEYSLLCSSSENFSGAREVKMAGTSGKNLLVASFGIWAVLLPLWMAFREKRKWGKGLSGLLLLILFAAFLTSCGGGGVDNDSSEATAKVSGLNHSATYYWKVIAEDGRGGSSESEIRRFSTTW